jgi:hypothetical protein
MKTVTASIDLADILRQRIDDCAVFDRRWKQSDEASDSSADVKLKELQRKVFSGCLDLFLNAKAGLVIPEDAARLAGDVFSDQDVAALHFAYQDFYGYQMVGKLNDVIRRARRVREVFAKKPPPESARRLCSEAYQSYLYGYHTASSALVRALIETALKERLAVEVGDLGKLNDEALHRRLYQRAIWHKINEIRKRCNAVLHEAVRGTAVGEAENLKLLGLAQEVLVALGSEGPAKAPTSPGSVKR